MEELQPTAESAQPIVVQSQNKNLYNLAFLQPKERKIKVSGKVEYDPYDSAKIVSASQEWQSISEMECPSVEQCFALIKRKNVFFERNKYTGKETPLNEEVLVNIPQHMLKDAINAKLAEYSLNFSSLLNIFRFCKNVTFENIETYITFLGRTKPEIAMQKEVALASFKTWSFGDYVFSVEDVLHIPTTDNISEKFINSIPENFLRK
jgi:hypothetical protein